MRKHWCCLLAFQSRPDLQGVKTSAAAQQCRRRRLPKQTRSSGGQNRCKPARYTRCRHLPKQTRSSGGQNQRFIAEMVRCQSLPKQTRSSGGQNGSRPPGAAGPCPFQSRPDLQGVKTCSSRRSTRSAAAFQSRPDLQGVKTTLSASPCHDHIFQSRPDLQGVKTVSRDFLDLGSPSKADPIFRGSNREGPRATSGGPVDAKPIVNE